MILLNERYQVKKFITEGLPNMVATPGWGNAIWSQEQKQSLLTQIQNLDPSTATAEDIAKIMGTSYYVRPLECHECGETSWDCVLLGEEPNYDSSHARICFSCLQKAVNLIHQSK